MFEKLKSFAQNDQHYYASLVLLVGLVSFALGRLSLPEGGVSDTPRISVQQAALPTLATKPVETRAATPQADPVSISGVSVVASKSGTKYHLLTCPGAGQIKAENRIEFASKDAAEAAGYTPAANCPGL